MRARRAHARVAVVLVLLLLATPRAAAEREVKEGYTRSKLSYVVPVAFVVSFVVIGAVLLRAALARSDDTARLRAATAKVDQALGAWPGWGSAGTAPYDTGSADRRQPRAAAGARLLEQAALRLAP